MSFASVLEETIFRGLRLLAVGDHLGSPRINTDQTGAVIARHDYMPFGEEIDGTGGRTTGLNYGDDSVRKQFTGYERDGETELDFAQARYYNKNHGRFTSADEPFADQDENDPQTWNLYAYSRNDPLRYSDPTGQGFWTKLWNYLNYSVWGEEEDVPKSEDLKRQWLAENKFYQQAPDGTWYPIDPTNMNRDDVWYFYNKYQLAIAEGRMVQLTPEQQAAANILPSISTAPPGATTTSKNLGPSGKVSTQKYLEENWEKSTFGSVKKTVAYHLKAHGGRMNAAQYTQSAIKAFNDTSAIRKPTLDKLGRAAVKVVSKFGEGIYTPKGKIITFIPK